MKHKWILIAEDDDKDADLTLRTLIADQLQPTNDVVVVHDGSEALDYLYHRKKNLAHDDDPAFVLLDLKMPKVDGWEVLRRIKADLRLKSIPVVVFTSSREETDLRRCYQMGANAYVVKPLDYQEFASTVRNLGAFWISVNEPPPELGSATNATVVLPAMAVGTNPFPETSPPRQRC